MNSVNLIIPFGTQIVLLKEVKIFNENRFQPKGTVAAISGLPADAFHAYKIKFLDESEAMANRKDFSIKKHFQNEQSGLISQLENFELYDFVIYRCIVGSKAFGLDDENSDTDLRASGKIKWKHAMHLIRLLLQGIGILRESDLIVRVEANRQTLLSIKRGETVWREVNELRLNLHKEFEKAFAETSLPERPNYEKANEFLIKARRSTV